MKRNDFKLYNKDVVKDDGFINGIKDAITKTGISIDQILLDRDLSFVLAGINAGTPRKGKLSARIRVADVAELRVPTAGEQGERRALRIKKRLEKGYAPQPVYYYNGELVEGRHRLIAFNWHGLKDIVVIEIRDR